MAKKISVKQSFRFAISLQFISNFFVHLKLSYPSSNPVTCSTQLNCMKTVEKAIPFLDLNKSCLEKYFYVAVNQICGFQSINFTMLLKKLMIPLITNICVCFKFHPLTTQHHNLLHRMCMTVGQLPTPLL